MRIIPPSHEILYMPDGDTILKTIELAGRTCYKSEDKITPDSAAAFIPPHHPLRAPLRDRAHEHHREIRLRSWRQP